MNIEVWHEVGKRIQNPNEACQFVSELMEICKDKMFNGLITTNFTNSPSQIYNSISAFCSECNKVFDLKAIYLEMNGLILIQIDGFSIFLAIRQCRKTTIP